MKLSISPAAVICLCGFLTFTSGCGSAALNLSKFMESHEKESPENFVEQVIPVWQEAEGTGLNGVPSKGFGGQIYFITHNRGLPSEVNGSVKIYVFDDQGTEEEQAKPIHIFDFTVESWKGHRTHSKLGPSYSVFLPYTRPGGRMAQCALRIRYTPEKGAPVFSQMVSVTMSGTNPNGTTKDGAEIVSDSSITARGKRSSGKVAQVSGSADPRLKNRVQQLGYETPVRQTQSGVSKSRNPRSSSKTIKSMSAKDAFLGEDPGDLPSDEESVEDLLSEDQDVDPIAASRGHVVDAFEEEAEDDGQSMRTYTIPLGR